MVGPAAAERGISRRTAFGALGLVAGAVVGGISGLNATILFGPDSGYQTAPGDLFEHSPILGLFVFSLYLLVPAAGAYFFARSA